MILIHQGEKHFRTDIARSGAIAQRVLRERALFTTQGEIRAIIPAVMAEGAPERPEDLLFALPFDRGEQALHRMDLIVQRTNVIDHQVILVLTVTDLKPLGGFREQVNDRRAVQGQMGAVDNAFQRRIGLIQQDDDVKRQGVIAALQERRQLTQADKLEACRECKILLQQAVAVKITQIVGQQGLLGRKAFLLKRVIRQNLTLRFCFHGLQDDSDTMLHQQLHQFQGLDIGSAQEKHHVIETELA